MRFFGQHLRIFILVIPKVMTTLTLGSELNKCVGLIYQSAMPQVVDDTKEEAMSNWKPALALAAASGLGGAVAGPLGQAGGAIVAGGYIGGQKGDVVSIAGAGMAGAQLLQAGMAGGSGGGNSRGSI